MMNKISYLIVRLTIGMSMFSHGLVRIPKLYVFSEGMIANFSDSLLPEVIVLPFSLMLPFLEFIIGAFLLLGYKTGWFAQAGGFLMVILIFGTSVIENWGALPSQLIHSAFFVVLLQFLPANQLSLDAYFKR